MVLTNVFEEFIDPALHSGSQVLATRGFGKSPPVDILANLQRLYVKLSYQELDAALLSLNETMNQLQPVKVMLCGIDEFQLSLLDNPDKYRALTEPKLISYSLIKLSKTGRIYAKGIKKWHKRPTQDRRKWDELSAHMIEDYKRKLTETGGKTNGT